MCLCVYLFLCKCVNVYLFVSLSVCLCMSVGACCLVSALSLKCGKWDNIFFIVILILSINVPVVDAVITIIDAWLVFSPSQPLNKHIRPKHIMPLDSKTAHKKESSEP